MRIEPDALIERLNAAIMEALDEKDKAARKAGARMGDQSVLAIEMRGCVSTVKQYFKQREEDRKQAAG